MKKTLVKAMVLGSVKENWFRDLLNAHLAQVLPSDVEYMVGLQKRHALLNGREIDIRAVSQQILSRIHSMCNPNAPKRRFEIIHFRPIWTT